MSIATLLLNDTSRTGVAMDFCPPRQTIDGIFMHPFMWNDGYQQLSEQALPQQLINRTVGLVDATSDAILRCIGTNTGVVLELLLDQNAALAECYESVTASPAEDFSKQVLRQIAQARMVTLYNIGVAKLTLTLRAAPVEISSTAVADLGAVAAFFQAVSNAEFGKGAISDAIQASPANLRVCSLLAAAAAAEVTVAYWTKDANAQLDKLCAASHRACALYRQLVLICERDATSVTDASAVTIFAHIKRLYYEGFTLFALSLQPGCTKGESRRRRASAAFDAALEWTLSSMPGSRKQVEDELQFWVNQCVNFNRLQKRGGILLASVSSTRRRHEDNDSLGGAEVAMKLCQRDSDLILVGKATHSDLSQGEAAQPAALVSVAAITAHRNLILANMPKAQSQLPYQYVTAVVTLSSENAPQVPEATRAKIAMALIVDLASSDAKLVSSQKEVLQLALKSGMLNNGDELLVYFHDLSQPGTLPAPTVAAVTIDGTEAPLERVVQAINACKPAGRFAGSRGTSIIPLIVEAQKRFAQPAYGSANCLTAVVTDALDRTAASTAADVAEFMASRDANRDWKYRTPVHSFCYSGIGQGEMLKVISGATRGNFASFFPECGDDNAGVAALRGWFVGIVTNASLTTMRAAQVIVTSSGDNFVHSAGIAAAVAPRPADPPVRSTSVVVPLPDMAAGQATRVCITIAVPTDSCSADIIGLGTIHVDYRDFAGTAQRASKPLVNISCPEIIDREMYPWLRQLRIVAARDSVQTSRPTEPTPRWTRIGETMYSQDSISTVSADPERVPNGALLLTTVEGLLIEVAPATKLTLTDVQVNDVTLDLQSGELAVMTASFGSLAVRVADQYIVRMQPSTIARVRVDQRSNTIAILIVAGRAGIELRGAPAKSLPEGATEVTVTAPKQTSARIGDGLAAPWALAEDGMTGFTPMSTRFATALIETAQLDVERIRGEVTQCLRQLGHRICRRNRIGTLTRSTAARRCRKFIASHRVTQAKQTLANSMAYAIGHREIDELKKMLDIAVNLGSPLAELKRTWAAVILVNDSCMSLGQRRPMGCCLAFASTAHRQRITALLSARDKAAAEREAAAAAKLKEAADAEHKRRQIAIATIFSLWDFGRRGVVSVGDIQAVLYSLSNRRHASIRRCIGGWEVLRQLIDMSKFGPRDSQALPPVQCFKADQLAAIVCHISEHLDGADFNAFYEAITECVKLTASTIEASRLDRSIYTLFTRLDTARDGYLQWTRRCVAVLRYTFGDGTDAFPRLEAFTSAAVDILNKLTPSEASRPASAAEQQQYAVNETATLSMMIGPAITVDTIDAEKITPVVFVTAMRAFFAGIPEEQANRDLALLCDHAHHYTKLRGDTAAVMLRARKDAEQRHVVEWDLPHVFDGVLDRHVRELIDPRWKQPEEIQEIAAPLCLLAGLVPLPAVEEPAVYLKAHNYWAAIRGVLKSDARAFFSFLLSFPVVSISHRQAQLVGVALRTKTFESAQLLRYSPVLSALCSWARIVLRLAFLEHDWEEAPLVQPDVATAIQAQLLGVPDLHCIREVPPEALPPPEERNLPVTETAPQHSRQFRPVYDRPPASVNSFRAASPFEAAIVSPRRPPSVLSASPSALRRPQSAAYGPSVVRATNATPSMTPTRPSTARPPSVLRPASAQKRSAFAAAAWHENDWEVPAGLNSDTY